MRIDLHVHTWYSKDGVSPPEKIIKTVQDKRERGLLDGIAVTDHNTTKAWESFKNADFPVILGEEVKTKRGEILGLFLKEEIKSREPSEVVDEIHGQDGIAILPHPFDKYRKSFKNPEEFARVVDGVEVFNSRMRTPHGNKLAFEFAEKNRLAMTGGSDAHIRWEVGNAFTESDAGDTEEFRKAIKKGKTRVVGKHSITWFLIPITMFAKLGLIGRAPILKL